MNRSIRILPLLAALAAPALAGDGEALLQHRLRDLQGQEQQLSGFRGQIVVVNFWASWCAPCRKELPVFERWQHELPDVRFAAISIDKELRNARRFQERQELTLPIYHDGVDGLASRLDLPSLPCTYVLDRDGRVAFVTAGATEEKLDELRRAIEGLRAAPLRASQGAKP